MGTIKQLFLFFLPALLLAGCNNEELPDGRGEEDQSDEITFEVGFAPQTRVETDDSFECTWEAGDEIGLFAVSRTPAVSANLQPSGNYIHNMKLTYDGTNWIPSEKLYYDGYDNVQDFYAYYPYDDNGGSPQTLDPTNIRFKVKTDQSDASNFSLSDLMTAKSDNAGLGYSKNNNGDAPIPLMFYHKLSMVKINLTIYAGKGFGLSENLAVKLRKMRPGVELNLNGINDGANASGITIPTNMDNDSLDINMRLIGQINPINPNMNTYTYHALVPAQNISNGKRMVWLDHEEWLFAVSGPAGYMGARPMLPGRYYSSNTRMEQGLLHTELIKADGETITEDFRISKYPVSFALYKVFCIEKKVTLPPDNGWGGVDRPVINVSHTDAMAFCEWLTQNTGVKCTLPTEAQWEYACRAGTTTRYSYGDTPDDNYMWYGGNSGSQTQEIGMKSPNSWGLYDMHGNVWEWCSNRVKRGGAWNSNTEECQSAYRLTGAPDDGSIDTGFRVVFLP